jgi:hypothetical protein
MVQFEAPIDKTVKLSLDWTAEGGCPRMTFPLPN